MDRKQIDELFKKYGVPIDERHREKVNEIIANEGCHGIHCGHHGHTYAECPFSALNHKGLCDDIKGGTNILFKNNQQMQAVFTRYIERLDKIKEEEMKEQVLDLERIMKDVDLGKVLFDLSLDRHLAPNMEYNCIIERDLIRRIAISYNNYKLFIYESGNLWQIFAPHPSIPQESEPLFIHNQRKIQQLLEPYWIDKPDTYELIIKKNGEQLDINHLSADEMLDYLLRVLGEK